MRIAWWNYSQTNANMSRALRLYSMAAFQLKDAWNKVGDVYVDVTYEMALKSDVTKELYMALSATTL